MPVEENPWKGGRPSGGASRDAKDLRKLLDILEKQPVLQQPVAKQRLSNDNTKSSSSPASSPGKTHSQNVSSTESLALEKFSLKYQNTRDFNANQYQEYFSKIFSALVTNRLCNQEWSEQAPKENTNRVLVCLRMLMRDPVYKKEFFNLGGVKVLSEKLQVLTEEYLEHGEDSCTVDSLKEMTNICQKLSADVEQREWLVACNTHKALILLLSANDVMVLHCSLYALISLAQSEQPRAMIGELNCIETLLRILQDYDVFSKSLAANLLRILCVDGNIREQIKVFDGIPICLSLLNSDTLKLLWNVVWIIVQLAEDPDSSNDLRLLGGIPLLLNLLQDQKYLSERVLSDGALSSSSSSSDWENEPMEEVLSLKTAVCAALTELVLNDTNAQQIVQNNGVYLIGVLILPQEVSSKEEKNAVETLQKSAFRALRFLFSMERNRQLFKRLFPPSLFETFIDVGHYVKDLSLYKTLTDTLNELGEEEVVNIKDRILASDRYKVPIHSVGQYAVIELLGSGAFGSVFKAKKKHGGQTQFAVKEISVNNTALGKTPKERSKSVGDIVNEATIMKEQLKHPNVVKYYKSFTENDKLYIVMELVEGAPLGEHFSSLKEKKERFQEERIWHIFIQIVLALRYIHKEKNIVHRDLTPNNIMLGENDKVTITDFGLAKLKTPEASKMTSVVGTILYSCPEIIQNLPYGEKADVWSAGCILYQMATLNPPFYSSNMLSLATKIVEAQYEPIPEGSYSEKLTETIQRCLTSSSDERPDIIQVGSIISDVMMTYVDKLRGHEISLEKKLERERKRTQKHFYEANINMQNYHRLFWASQERYDKLMNLASSGGASGLRLVGSDNVFDVMEAYAQHTAVENVAGADLSSSDSGIYMSIDNTGSESAADRLADCIATSDSKKSLKKISKSNDKQLQGNSSNAQSESTAAGPVAGIPDENGAGIKTLPSQSGQLFQVPKPPHKGARRHLNLDPLDIKSANALSRANPLSSPAQDYMNRRTQSSSSVEIHRRQASSAGSHKPRPSSGAATLSISPRKVRQISDPILQILNQLHKIIFITQLPPTLTPSPQRRIIERFKRSLFAPQSTSLNLKSELKKVVEGSHELIDLDFGIRDPSYLKRQESMEGLEKIGVESDGQEIGVTYEQLQAIVENVLMETGYYNMGAGVRSRATPLGPIGSPFSSIPSASSKMKPT